MNHDAEIKKIQDMFWKLRPANYREHCSCIIWAIATLFALSGRALLQAGSCMWPRIRKEDDDGVIATHFGYEWHPNSQQTRERIAAGLLPEMHIWAAIPSENQIIDLTTKFFPQQCHSMLKWDWPGIEPPEYFWGGPEDLPEGVLYRPSMDAIQLASTYALNIIHEIAEAKRRAR